MSLCQYAMILRKGGVTEYTSVNRKCDVQQPSWASCVHTDEGTSRKAQGFAALASSGRARVMPAGKHRQELAGFLGSFPGNLSMPPFAWHISSDNYLYEQR